MVENIYGTHRCILDRSTVGANSLPPRGKVSAKLTDEVINGTSRVPSPTEYAKSEKRDSFHHLRWSPFLKEEGRDDVGAVPASE